MGILYSYALIGLVMLRLVTPDFGTLAKQVSLLQGLHHSNAGKRGRKRGKERDCSENKFEQKREQVLFIVPLFE